MWFHGLRPLFYPVNSESETEPKIDGHVVREQRELLAEALAEQEQYVARRQRLAEQHAEGSDHEQRSAPQSDKELDMNQYLDEERIEPADFSHFG